MKMVYINQENACMMFNRFYGMCETEEQKTLVLDMKQAFLEIRPSDAVEPVRCKECLFGHRDHDYEYGYTCVKPLYHPGIGEMPHRKLMQNCDYCSHGVRRED